MKRALLLVAVLASTAIALGGIALAAPKATITVGNNFLAPGKKTVSAGTKVSFKWAGGERHLIVKRKGPGPEIESPATSRKGVHLARVLSKRGTYLFVCAIHPAEMRLKLTVK